ncbi:Pfam:DUF803 [Geosmithia morbida]|uniref:Pfam:DUF803 n=1 Tax=Geosmithia morbida TaxID=1094350 RepID=A0A9P4Z3S2_9HYPO|nr:Pfam:DUF803 [Geosmithia morbida]KAF4126922.1 Pfam:DUF803 [Geosmithia morbida]
MEMEHMLLSRNGVSVGGGDDRPSFYKAVGIGLAIGSGCFIGVSFVMKKVGLLRANEKYNEVAGEGYGYLRNGYWWGGMTLMILGEICNFVAYAFTDAILVTPLGALSVVITTVLSAIFLKERLSMVGKVSCFLCIVGSVIIVMNAPESSAVKDIQEMQKYVITPGFLTYSGVIIVGSGVAAFWAGPRWGNRNMLVYISICSWVGGLSVVATQGLGSAIIAWIGGEPQYKQWFLWVLFVFVIATLLTEIIFLNKALNIFNAALVTPTYYVYFTSTTIITSAVLFQGFKGTTSQIVTMVLGFLTICSGVVLLQLSKAAKDVPDAAVFQGDLDQIQTIAEQEQPESEPKADAIRGAAGLVRRFSRARLRMEEDELRRLHEEKKMMETMQAIDEHGHPIEPEYEWDGLRRRRTTTFSSARRPPTAASATLSNRSLASPLPPLTSMTPSIRSPRSPHPPLGMSRFPDDYDHEGSERGHRQHHDDDRSIFSSITGSFIRHGSRGRSRTATTMPPYDEEDGPDGGGVDKGDADAAVYLEEMSHQRPHPTSYGHGHGHVHGHGGYGYAPAYQREIPAPLYDQDTSYRGGSFNPARAARTRSRSNVSRSSLSPPTPPPHMAQRNFSFNKVFRRAHDPPTEEERAGLVIDDGGDGGAVSDQDQDQDQDGLNDDGRRGGGGGGGGGGGHVAFV